MAKSRVLIGSIVVNDDIVLPDYPEMANGQIIVIVNISSLLYTELCSCENAGHHVSIISGWHGNQF